MDIRATAKCPETIRSRYQERQCGAAGRRITKGDRITEFCVTAPFAPGDTFNYNSGNSQLLSAIITKLTGMDARDYAKAKLFAPLGISTSNWLRDPQLLAIGGFGLAMLPRDMAKIGYLYLRNGEWKDKRLLPPAWIDKVTHATVDMKRSVEPDLRYSNSFWALPNKQVYMAVGYHCQLIMVFPELDIVAVTTARDFCPFSKLADYISNEAAPRTDEAC
jgi:CubicO group peptidase (beta-lactamase class C family)